MAPSLPIIWRYFEHQSVFNIELVKLKACVRFESRIKARSVQRAIKVKPPWGRRKAMRLRLRIILLSLKIFLASLLFEILEACEVLSNVRNVENAKKANLGPELTDTKCNWWPLQRSQHCSVQYCTLGEHSTLQSAVCTGTDAEFIKYSQRCLVKKWICFLACLARLYIYAFELRV